MYITLLCFDALIYHISIHIKRCSYCEFLLKKYPFDSNIEILLSLSSSNSLIKTRKFNKLMESINCVDDSKCVLYLELLR